MFSSKTYSNNLLLFTTLKIIFSSVGYKKSICILCYGIFLLNIKSLYHLVVSYLAQGLYFFV